MVKQPALQKKGYCAALLVAAAMTLSGCMFISSPEELYALPRLPEEYTGLETEIADLVNNKGYEYAAPVSGENVQLVQMVDLDGDGTDEALVFLRKSGDVKPLQIHIFKQEEDGYRPAAVIQESGAAIAQVDYRDMNGDGVQEIIVGWRMTMDAANAFGEGGIGERMLSRVVSVYNMERYDCQKVLETNYNQYILADLDNNGLPELITIAGGASGNCDASAYEWNIGVMEQKSVTRLTMSPAMVDEVRVGMLTDGTQALFVTGLVDEQTLATDILLLKGNGLVNCVLDEFTDTSRLTYRNASLRARDINADGVLEVPVSYLLPKYDPAAQDYWAINWMAFSSDGTSRVEECTYHNLTDGWYIVLPESWKDHIMITSVVSSVGERAVTFGLYQGEETPPMDLMTVYTETGDNREYKAGRGSRFVLMRHRTTVYAAEFLEGYENWSGAMSQDAMGESFHLIRNEWYLD